MRIIKLKIEYIKKYSEINKIKIIIKILIFFILYVLNVKYFINKFNSNKKKNVKVCICTLGKEENKYIREFVNHYEKLGIDKIFLYDNNDIDGEHFEDVIKDYIDKGLVQILNWRGKIKAIYKIMNDCYSLHNKNYDWLVFYELDEFIHLYNFRSIKNFLGQKKFNKCEVIYLNFVHHTDNNLLYYENKSLAERFPELEQNAKKNIGFQSVKSIMRGHKKNFKILHIHYLSKNLKYCNGFGVKNKLIKYRESKPDYSYYYIDHYYSKSTEEFINKVNRGDAYCLDLSYKLDKVKKYFSYNKITLEKIEMIEKGTGLNLTDYKKRIYKLKK